jgi:hypothetical protein
MRLIGEATFDGDLAQRCCRRQHQLPGTLDAATGDVVLRRHAGALAEGASEMKPAQSHAFSKLPIADALAEIAIDLGVNPQQLPPGEPAARALMSVLHVAKRSEPRATFEL